MIDYDYLLKFIIIGNTNVGKSCLMMQFLEKKFKNSLDPTIGVEFGSKRFKIKNYSMKLQIWDTAGQESFRSITRSYFRGAIGALVVFDVTSKQSFLDIEKWIKEVTLNTSQKIEMILIGNKIDKVNERVVTTEEGQSLADSKGLMYLETSAKEYQTVERAFLRVVENILGKIE